MNFNIFAGCHSAGLGDFFFHLANRSFAHANGTLHLPHPDAYEGELKQLLIRNGKDFRLLTRNNRFVRSMIEGSTPSDVFFSAPFLMGVGQGTLFEDIVYPNAVRRFRKLKKALRSHSMSIIMCVKSPLSLYVSANKPSKWNLLDFEASSFGTRSLRWRETFDFISEEFPDVKFSVFPIEKIDEIWPNVVDAAFSVVSLLESNNVSVTHLDLSEQTIQKLLIIVQDVKKKNFKHEKVVSSIFSELDIQQNFENYKEDLASVHDRHNFRLISGL